MGQIAEDMIDGTCCSECGQYFKDENDELYTHWYPVACKDCHDENSSVQLALVDTF